MVHLLSSYSQESSQKLFVLGGRKAYFLATWLTGLYRFFVGAFKCFVASVANTDPWFFKEMFLYLHLFEFFVIGCLGHDFLEGVRPSGILGSDFLDVISVVQDGLPFFA